MNDYWNDPTEQAEVPECCEEPMQVEADGSCTCLKCHLVVRAEVADSQVPEEEVDGPELCHQCGKPNVNGCLLCNDCGNGPCPHGNAWHDCPACDHAADLAFDADRESRLR